MDNTNNIDIIDDVNAETGELVIFKTNMGSFEIKLNKETPKTVDNFKKLVNEGFYDGVKFHRIIPGFMIQGGDPLTKDDTAEAMWGTGGPGYMFEDEIGVNNSNVIGTISMANAGPNTNGSQFFINTADNGMHLDNKHTVFGEVVSGMEVVKAIEAVETKEKDIPVSPVIIESIRLVE
ncbi:MAG: peptidylprolyl isomerase [Candidatus Pacebacteria bacterium]|nr:peptidylprolyl isomerase [Candidatus Paceibacterota bacterium]